jgi:hypothetical protein
MVSRIPNPAFGDSIAVRRNLGGYGAGKNFAKEIRCLVSGQLNGKCKECFSGGF